MRHFLAKLIQYEHKDNKMPNKTALIVGASGLIGQHCLQQLLNDDNYQQVTALVRRPLGIQHPKLLEYRVDFDRLAHSEEQQKERFTVDDVYCCLGTTIKAAGS
ncbi:MAG: NAD(P)-dependent dehydrogenase (short-subunit alcohol dehydrogenase family), partial [Phenylobacterium sp.]